MSYSLATIWYERNRFLPAVLAVAFSALLIALQSGLVLSLLAMMSLPVDKSAADFWVGFPGVRSVDLGRPIPYRWETRLLAQPEVEQVEPCLIGFAMWSPPPVGGSPSPPEACTVVGTRLSPDALGVVEQLRRQPEVLARLAQPGAVVVDATDFGRLGITGVGDTAEIMGNRVKVVGLTHGYKSLGGPYVFCSLETARPMLHYFPDDVTYLLGRCRDPEQVPAVVARLRQRHGLEAFTSRELSVRSQLHWLTTTKAGIALGFTALLGLLVGAVVTSQTLYAATAASQREFATLRAMGIPRWRLKFTVLEQSFWVGLLGILVAGPLAFLLAQVAAWMGTPIDLAPAILGAAAGITMAMALLSGLAALRSFQRVDPAQNIR
ncbi:MAG TPA: ABC transporter permease [Gemmataceae bacterium]